MATLQKLRNQAGLLLAIVIFIALASFILGDLLKSGSSIIRGEQLEIAEIDGESIEYPDFQERFNAISNVYKQNNNVNTLDDNAYQQVLNQAWENLVKEFIMTDIYDNLDIEITSDEMFDMVQGNNLHPIIVQVFGNPQTGQVDKSAVIQFLKYVQENPDAPQKASWLNIEKEIIKAKKMSKYTDLVAKGLYANSLQAKQNMAISNKVASLKFIQKKFSSISDSAVTYTNSDLNNYYEQHIDNYEQKAQQIVTYVAFDIVPSTQDDIDVQKWMAETKVAFIKADDNVQFVNMNSDNRFEDVYQKSTELSSNIAGWASEASVNDVFGPYKENGIYKVVRLNAIKMLPDSVKASHILIRAKNANEAQSASAIIDSLKKVLDSGDATFEQLAKDNSQDGSAASGGDLGWFKRGQMVAPFEKAAFRANKNDIVTVQTQFGFHLIKVVAQSKKTKQVQLAVVDREVTPSTTTYQHIYSKASKFTAKARNLEGFNTVAAEQKLSPRRATLSVTDRKITGIGSARELVRAAFNNTEAGELVISNDKSAVFELNNKFIVAAVVSNKEEGVKEFDAVKSTVELAVIKEKKKAMLVEQFKQAKSTSIEETAKKLSLSVESAEGFNFNFGSVNAIGYEPPVNGAAAALKVNQLSNPISGRNGVYFIELTNIEGEASDDVEAEKLAIYKSSSYRANYQAYQTLKDNIEIVDKRSKFY